MRCRRMRLVAIEPVGLDDRSRSLGETRLCRGETAYVSPRICSSVYGYGLRSAACVQHYNWHNAPDLAALVRHSGVKRKSQCAKG